MQRLWILTALLCANASFAQPVELRFAAPSPPVSPITTGLADWAKQVEGASAGTLAIRVVPGPALANFENVYDRVLKGIADIGFGTSNEIGGQFRKTLVAGLPFETENVRETAVALWRTMERGLIADEYVDVKPLAIFSFPHNIIHTRNVRVRSLADLKGLKLRVGGKIDGDVLSALGGAPIALPPTETYQAINSGLVEGTVMGWTGIATFKLQEVTRHHFNAQLTLAPAFVVMNKRSYEKLPPQAKAALDKLSGEALSRRMAGIVAGIDDRAIGIVKSMQNHNIDIPAPEEAARWRKQLEAISVAWVKDTPNGAAVLSGFREEIKKVRAEGVK
jgi:TRAP-type C4-dicarboxylate transport system substrate-binding protein